MTAMPPGNEPDQPMNANPPSPSPDSEQREPELPSWARRPQRSSGSPLTEERLAAYIGPKWSTTYERKLAPFIEEPTFVPTWNWSAALSQLLLPASWFLYRKLYFPFAIFFLVPGVALSLLTSGANVPGTMAELTKPENEFVLTMMGAVNFSAALAAGGTANWFLFRRARAATAFVAQQQVGPQEDTALMARLGGVNKMATALFVTLTLVLSLFRIAA